MRVPAPGKRQTLSGVSQPLRVGKSKAYNNLNVSTLVPTGAYKIRGKVNQLATSLLIDTGSPVTLVRGDVWDQCKKESQMLEPWIEQRLVGVDGTPLAVRGSTLVDLELDGTVLKQRALIVDSLVSESILGLDFLQENGCTIDLVKGCLQLAKSGVSISVGQQQEGPRQVTVQLTSKICIPPRSEIEILARTQHSIDGGTWLLEGRQVNNCSALVARAVVSPSNSNVIVHLLNPHSHSITVHQKTGIATLEEINSVCVVSEGAAKCMNESDEVPKDKKQMFLEMVSKCSPELSDEEKDQLLHFLLTYSGIFAGPGEGGGRTDKLMHKIDTGDAHPIRQAARRIPPHKKEEVSKLLQDMLQKDIVERSSSPWASPIVLVKKKDGSTRFCVDYRKLNSVTRKDAYPLPRIDDTLDTLHGSMWFTTLDLASGYWQVGVEKRDQHRTAFSTPNGLFEFKVMPFGLCNAPATFQRLMDLVLAGLQWSSCLVYLDDIIILGKDFKSHLENLSLVLQRIKDAGLRLKTTKCAFFQDRVNYLGHVVSRDGVSVDQLKVNKVKNWPVPKTSKEVQQFLGLANYYRRFVQGFANTVRPLHRLTEKTAKFTWTAECQAAFDELRYRLCDTPVLSFPDYTKSFILDTDASDTGLGAVISQLDESGHEHVIAYGSRLLSKTERKYCVTRRELLAVVTFVKHFRPYLLGRRFTLRTDHGSLIWLRNFHEPEGQLARWLETLQEYDFEIIHRKGRLHCNADALSRIPCDQQDFENGFAGENDVAIQASALVGRTAEDIKILQEDDPLLGPVKEAKSNNLQPSKEEQKRGSPSMRRLYQLWDQLQLIEGVLYCKFPQKKFVSVCSDKLVVPEVLKKDILNSLHEGPFGGHLGEDKTLEKLKERFYWPGQYNDVRDWCRTCSVCASRKTPAPKPRASLKPVRVGSPMQLVAVDILGPLPESRAGNSYVLVAADYLTRWVEAYPIPNQEAITVARKLTDELFCRFSLPEQLHSDQGRQFESEILTHLCKFLHIDKTRTTPYHPQSDGLVERFNRTLIQMLSTCIEDHPFEWEDHIHKVCMAYNSSKQATTGYSPFYLMFGREARLPVDIMYRTPSQKEEVPLAGYVSNLRDLLHEAYERVRENVGEVQERQEQLYNRKVHGEPHKPGALVWLFNPAVPRGKAKKFHRPWTGPYRIIRKLSDANYFIRHIHNHKKKVVHFDRLKSCPKNIRLPPRLSSEAHQSSVPPPSAPGTYLDLIDDDDDAYFPQQHNPPTTGAASSMQSSVPRYPSRTHHPPDRYGFSLAL